MLKLPKQSKELAVEFCGRGARVFDAGCRAAAIGERALVQALRLGVRF